MSEIRDFLVEMNVPNLNSPQFASQFDTFCKNIKDNINKIVSAPFLKGDRGSKISFIDEPMKIDGQWTNFAKNLISSIYKTTGENPLPLMPDGELVSQDDEEMKLIDGGSVIIEEPVVEGEGSIKEKYCSFDLFRDLESIPVCYDEATGKKFLCVPFYFFDGRLDYVGHMDNNALPMFRDMSCVVFGEASFIENPTKEKLSDPNSWQWEMTVSNALPKLYYNQDTKQFCWEISGELTNITAQGVKGDKGDSANIWVCEGEVVDGDNIKKINISNLSDSETGFLVKDIKEGDLAIVSYNDNSPMAASGEEEPYYRIQFGYVHATRDDRWIIYNKDSEIIGRLRNYSLHDYLMSIGDPDAPDTISALYALERDTRNVAIAIWAKSSTNHYIAPIPKIETEQIGDAEENVASGRTLNILYDTVKFKKKIVVDNIESTNGLNTNATNVLNSISGNNLKSYRLGVLCNVLGVQKSDTQMLARIGEGGQGFHIYDNIGPIFASSDKPSTADYLFMECEIVLGWIPEEIALIFNDNLSSNTNNPALDIYRAQKYHLYLRIPVENSNATAGISLDGRSWSNNISLTDSLSYRGNNRTFTISLDSNMRFEEKIKFVGKEHLINWFNQFIGANQVLNHKIPYFDGRTTVYEVDSGYEFFYEYLAPNMTLRKDKVQYSDQTTSFKLYLNQYKLSGGGLSMTSGQGNAQYKVDNLIWFGSRNINPESESKSYPLINDKFSFLNYFKKNDNYITTTNNANNWMWQGRVLSADATGGSSLGKQDLYYINTSFYETLCPSDFNVFIVKNPDSNTYNPNQRHISMVPINSAIHIYPEGMCGLAYDRVIVTNTGWGQTPVNQSQETIGNFVPAYQNT